MNSKEQITEERTTALLEASIKFENGRKSGLGHQFDSESRQLTACKEFLEQAMLALPKGDKFLELKRTLFTVTCQVSNEIAGAKEKFEENE